MMMIWIQLDSQELEELTNNDGKAKYGWSTHVFPPFLFSSRQPRFPQSGSSRRWQMGDYSQRTAQEMTASEGEA
jgi:hypothetical protein